MATNAWLYPPEGVVKNVRLRDPTVLAPSGAAISLASDVTLAVNDRGVAVLEESGAPWLEELDQSAVLEEAGLDLATFTISAMTVRFRRSAVNAVGRVGSRRAGG